MTPTKESRLLHCVHLRILQSCLINEQCVTTGSILPSLARLATWSCWCRHPGHSPPPHHHHLSKHSLLWFTRHPHHSHHFPNRTQVTLGVTLHHEVTSPQLLGRRKQTHMTTTTFTVAITAAPFVVQCRLSNEAALSLARDDSPPQSAFHCE